MTPFTPSYLSLTQLTDAIDHLINRDISAFHEFNRRMDEDPYILLNSEVLISVQANQIPELVSRQYSDQENFSICVTETDDLICAVYRIVNTGELSSVALTLAPTKLTDLEPGTWRVFKRLDEQLRQHMQPNSTEYMNAFSSISIYLLSNNRLSDICQLPQLQQIAVCQQCISDYEQQQVIAKEKNTI